MNEFDRETMIRQGMVDARSILSQMNTVEPIAEFDINYLSTIADNLWSIRMKSFEKGYLSGLSHERDKPWWKRLFNLDA